MSKKMIIWTFIIFAIFAAWVIRELTDNRPVKFEKYKTSEELKAFLDKQYPIGSDAEKAFNDFKKSGTYCKNFSPPNIELNIKTLMRCVYSSGWLSLNPLVDYIIVLSSDHNNKIVKIECGKGYVGP
jgi:hypothetical protein